MPAAPSKTPISNPVSVALSGVDPTKVLQYAVELRHLHALDCLRRCAVKTITGRQLNFGHPIGSTNCGMENLVHSKNY